jgi:hypothetical protein
VVETPSRDGKPRREVGEAAEAPRFDDATAAPYVGWYYSDELDAVYRVALGERGLELRHARHGAMPLIPLGMGDAFGVDGQAVVGVTFSRGREGTATGLELKARSWDARSFFRRVGGPDVDAPTPRPDDRGLSSEGVRPPQASEAVEVGVR